MKQNERKFRDDVNRDGIARDVLAKMQSDKKFDEIFNHIEVTNNEMGCIKQDIAVLKERLEWNTKISYLIFATSAAIVLEQVLT